MTFRFDRLARSVPVAETKFTPIDIESDAKEINSLVLAAKQGTWATVWAILGEPDRPRKGYLVNVIPEGRRWGILHQAVHWKTPENVQKILKYKSCDVSIPTKQCTFANGEVGKKTAEKIAKMYKDAYLEWILGVCKMSDFNDGLETFQTCSPNGQMKEFPIMTITLAAYKQTFHPNTIAKGKPLFEVMKDIFHDIERSEERWKVVKEKVCESIEGECCHTYRQISTAQTRSAFYGSIILTYTEEASSRLYTYLNTAMRRQKEDNYRPTAKDLALGPFILMYQILLLHWRELGRETCTTYRRMKVTNTDLRKYQIGTSFMWVSFVSSSSVRRHANIFPTCGPSGDQTILFVIDNKKPSIWQPRNIEKYASYVENERTYPAGAHFLVTDIKRGRSSMHIYLQLIN